MRLKKMIVTGCAALALCASIADESANTWQANANGEWSGSWTDPDHWSKGAVVTCTTNATTGAYGKIAWKSSGFLLLIK